MVATVVDSVSASQADGGGSLSTATPIVFDGADNDCGVVVVVMSMEATPPAPTYSGGALTFIDTVVGRGTVSMYFAVLGDAPTGGTATCVFPGASSGDAIIVVGVKDCRQTTGPGGPPPEPQFFPSNLDTLTPSLHNLDVALSDPGLVISAASNRKGAPSVTGSHVLLEGDAEAGDLGWGVAKLDGATGNQSINYTTDTKPAHISVLIREAEAAPAADDDPPWTPTNEPVIEMPKAIGY